MELSYQENQNMIPDLKIGDVVQLHPTGAKNPCFAGCFMVIMKLKDFCAYGYVPTLGENLKAGAPAYYRATFDEMVKIGEADYIIAT